MTKMILDPKELIGFCLLSGEEISASDTISVKMTSKTDMKRGDKSGGWTKG